MKIEKNALTEIERREIILAANNLFYIFGNCAGVWRDDCGVITGKWFAVRGEFGICLSTHLICPPDGNPRDYDYCRADDNRILRVDWEHQALLHLRLQIGPAAPVPEAYAADWRRITRAIEYCYCIAWACNDTRFTGGSDNPPQSYSFAIFGNTRSAIGRTECHAYAQYVVDVGRRAGLIQRG